MKVGLAPTLAVTKLRKEGQDCDVSRHHPGPVCRSSGYTAARRGEAGTAWRYWVRARAMADCLSADHYHPVTSFSRAIMGAHAVTVAMELHQGGESVRQAAAADADTIPSRQRRARHRIEEARGYLDLTNGPGEGAAVDSEELGEQVSGAEFAQVENGGQDSVGGGQLVLGPCAASADAFPASLLEPSLFT